MSENPLSGPRDVYPEMREGDAGVLAPAMLMGMVMTALADGPLSQNEKDALVEVFYAGNRWNMSPRTLLAHLQRTVDGTILVGEEHWPTMLEKARGLSGPSKIQVLHACAKMAHMDGDMTPEEELRIESIASWIGIERQDLETWRSEYRRFSLNSA